MGGQRVIQAPEELFASRLEQQGLTREQAQQAMQFLQQMRAGPVTPASFQALPERVQMAVNSAMNMWNGIAPEKRSLSQLTPDEINSITSQRLRTDVIATMPIVFIKTGARSYEAYTMDHRYAFDLDQNQKFLEAVRSGLELAASAEGRPYQDITSPQNPADQFALNNQMMGRLFLLTPADVLRSVPRRLQ